MDISRRQRAAAASVLYCDPRDEDRHGLVLLRLLARPVCVWCVCVLLVDVQSAAECPDSCNDHGDCVDRLCHCFPGYAGPTCAEREYPPVSARRTRFITARCCACAVLAIGLCLSVCLSQVGVLLKWLDGSSWFLAWRLLSTSPTVCFKEIQVSAKIRVLPSGTFS